MRVFVCPHPGEMGKFEGVVRAFPEIWKGRVLDVGCRSGNLSEVLRARGVQASYVGLDLFPPATVRANLEKGLPFRDRAFTVVVALDVLEHTNDIHGSFGELCRVSERFVVISLPNMYELKARWKVLWGQRVSGKYGLPVIPPTDRHRWFFSLREAQEFVHAMAQRRGFVVRSEGGLVGPGRARGPERVLVRKFPNLLVPTYLVLLERA